MQHTTPSQRLISWEHDPRGQFALDQEKSLLLKMTSHWRRRHRSMLHIECGTGHFLEVFWDAGFDLSATVSTPDELHRARTRIGRRAELHLAKPDHLPFEDNAYDYVLLLTALDFCPHPEALLSEAGRVCAKEMLVSFLNKHSLYAMPLSRKKHSSRTPHPVTWWSWPSLRLSLLRTIGPKSVRSRAGILPGPYLTWQSSALCKTINALLFPNIFGAYCVAIVDMTGESIFTPLPAWVQQGSKTSAPCSNRVRTDSPPTPYWKTSSTEDALHRSDLPALLHSGPE
jgi:hypothetical protein